MILSCTGRATCHKYQWISRTSTTVPDRLFILFYPVNVYSSCGPPLSLVCPGCTLHRPIFRVDPMRLCGTGSSAEAKENANVQHIA